MVESIKTQRGNSFPWSRDTANGRNILGLFIFALVLRDDEEAAGDVLASALVHSTVDTNIDSSSFEEETSWTTLDDLIQWHTREQ